MNEKIPDARADLIRQLFPKGVPRLWCPALTHYAAAGAMDRERITAHIRKISERAKGFLIPGSTSDGWELSDAEFAESVDIALECAREMNFHLLIGALKPTVNETLRLINQVARNPKYLALARSLACGFAVCAPRGAGLSQAEIGRAMDAIFETGLPMAFYQLPQMTQNEAGPEVVGEWVRKYPNFILFKDSSGADRIIHAKQPGGGVFAMRGAESDYFQWFKGTGGPYDGFLLSTANCFAAEYGRMFDGIDAGRLDEARALSDKLSKVIGEAFDLVKGVPDGNAFANANKAMDHFFAHGPNASDLPAPRLHSGRSLPAEVIVETGKMLSRHGLMPRTGYLA
jgi:dihydrodipicolinate synthase/N-acetylneuraminate lyase